MSGTTYSVGNLNFALLLPDKDCSVIIDYDKYTIDISYRGASIRVDRNAYDRFLLDGRPGEVGKYFAYLCFLARQKKYEELGISLI